MVSPHITSLGREGGREDFLLTSSGPEPANRLSCSFSTSHAYKSCSFISLALRPPKMRI